MTKVDKWKKKSKEKKTSVSKNGAKWWSDRDVSTRKNLNRRFPQIWPEIRTMKRLKYLKDGCSSVEGSNVHRKHKHG